MDWNYHKINIGFGCRIFEIKYFEEYLFQLQLSLITFGCLRELSVSCALKLNYYFTFYWIKFLYEIWDYYNQALFYVNFSDFSPFIRLWIVFLDWITKIFIEIFLKSKLTNISYKDMQNLSSPSDCIQFPVSDNERMMISCIIHISDSRNSTVNWSWGVETQTGF